ncbi:MAG TPA: carbamoyl-phosphate synthase large subunit [Chloroflexota bacterium]
MIRSALILGSGPIVIGQAAEFDYSGTQACLACREAGVRTILVNSNPATIQTDPSSADAVYIEPLTVESVEEIIARERPEGLIATVGGQTGLNLAVALSEQGVLTHYGVRLLGTGLEAIQRGEDRALFAETLRAAGQPILPSVAVCSVREALEAAKEIGYPVMCRSAFALGGAGSGFAADTIELQRQVSLGLQASGSGQVLIERSVRGWAEIEYEVVRDADSNCMIVCNMENVDPMGVHTGDSIVVAPSQTLDDEEYQMLRRAARRVVDALGVEGACNVQFALDRASRTYYVIEVNPRLSRSSALASKATGYPIAKVATQIALGRTLPEIRNDITGTSAFFEPALDYVTVKIPRWPFDKLAVSRTIGTRMRSTGEVMAIGRSFEEAMRKALRSLDLKPATYATECRDQLLREPNGDRLPIMLDALADGWEVDRVVALSGIHPWFVDRLAAVACPKTASEQVYKMVDTCSAEFEARTPYFYGTAARGENEAIPLPGPKAIILGAGPIRIGQGIEFDYATVHACKALTEYGVRSIVINNNPETISTDYSTSDRLYFEPLDVEAVSAVIQNEADGLLGVIPQFGGQTAINLIEPLQELGAPILGTSPESIDIAEDRAKTSALLNDLDIPAPSWRSISRWEDLGEAIEAVGLPALLRPSYVLSGQGMIVVRTRDDVQRYLDEKSAHSLDKPLLIDAFLEGAVELNVDAVSDGEDVVLVVLEQIEECGAHSGDSTDVYPVQTIDDQTVECVEKLTRRIARSLHIVGLMNVQYAVHGETVYVLEVNPRASRSVPFASKATGIPLAALAVRVILGAKLHDLDIPPARVDRICVKRAVFPWETFPELPPLLGPQMQSTGESMGSGCTYAEAYWKSLLGARVKHLPFGRTVCVSLPEHDPALIDLLQDAGCTAVPPDSAGIDDLGMAIVLDRSPEALALLGRAAAAGVPCITTPGALAGLVRALREGHSSWQGEVEEGAA